MLQFIKFCIVGSLSLLVDAITLFAFTEAFGFSYMFSNCISFSVSVLFNYMLSMNFVFKSVNKEDNHDLIIFVVLSIIGLGINEYFLKFFVDTLEVHYIVSKIFATAISMIFNFISRKIAYEGGFR